MASEKFRKELKDDQKISVFSRVFLGVSIVQVVVALGAFMSNTVESALLAFFAVTAIALLIVSAFLWDSVPAYRRTVRTILIALIGGLLLFGVGCAVYTINFAPPVDSAVNLSASNVDADPGYILLFDMAIVSTFTQVILGFFLPTLVVGASTKRFFDRVLLCVLSTLHAAIMAFMVFCTSQSGIGMPMWNTEETVMPTWMLSESIEITLVQVVVLTIAVAVAAMSYVNLFMKKK